MANYPLQTTNKPTYNNYGSGGFMLGALPIGVSGVLVTNANTIGLEVTTVTKVDVWTGNASTNWDIGATANWQNANGTGATTYGNGDQVRFDDTATNANAFVTTTVSPGSIIVDNTYRNYTIGGGAISGSGGLTKQGGGPLTLSGANSYTGGTTLSSGILNIDNSSALGAAAGAFTIAGGTIDNTSAGALTLANNNPQNWNGDFAFNGTQDLNLGAGDVTLGASCQVAVNAGTLTVGGNLNDNGSGDNLTKSGPGTLTLAGVNNNYGGNTTINSGTLKVTGGGLPATTTIAFANTTGTAALDLTGQTQTAAGLTFATQTTGSNTVSILGDAAASLTVAPATLLFAPASSAGTLTVDMSSLGSFTYDNASGTVTVDNGTAAGAAGVATVTLAGTSDSITAGNLKIADRGGTGNYVQTSTLNLGTNATLNVDAIGVGNSGSRGSGHLVAGSGTLTVRGANGGDNSANLTIGRSDSYEASDHTTSTFDASPGTLDALFGTIIVGQDSSGSSSARGITINAALSMGAGTLTANTLTLGSLTGSYAGGTYSITSLLNLNGAGTATITNLVLADEPASGSPTLTLNSQVNINGGATLDVASIGQGNVAGVTTLTTTVNWTNGTIGNISGGDLSVSGVSLVLDGSSTFNIDATSVGSSVSSVVSGAGALAKSGAGTLTLLAANIYTGDTAINAGTLALGSSGSIAGSTNIVIAGGATFDVSATSFAVIGQTLSNSTSTAVINGSLDATSGSLGLSYAAGTPAISVQNGSLTLAAATPVTVNNMGVALGNGSYKLISAGVGGSVGGALPLSVAVTGNGLGTGGTASLSLTGSELYLDVSGVVNVNTNSPVLTNTVSGNTLTLSWPSDHLGWRLEVQTNSLSAGLGANWVTWPNSTNLTTVPVTIDPASPTVFFRLVYP